MSRVRANTGRILLGTKEVAYCTGIDIEYDFAPIVHYAADRQYPVDIIHGDSSMTITVESAEYNVSESYVIDEIAQNGTPVTVSVFEGIRGGGFPATVITNCVVTSFKASSKQGEVVKATITLQKRSDS
jgi:hypothetical protein